MAQDRYPTETHNPSRQSLGKPEIKRFDEDIQTQWDALQARRRELSHQLGAVKTEQNGILQGLGAWVLEGCDWREYTDRLAELRAEAEALQAALTYADNLADKIKRNNNWLR